MKYFVCVFFISLTVCIFPGCKPKTSKQLNLENTTNDMVLIDSIIRIDSLVNTLKVSNNNQARLLSRQAFSFALKSNSKEAQARALLTMGIAFLNHQNDSSYLCYSKALNLAVENKILKIQPKLLYNLAMIYRMASNPKMAVIYLDSSICLAQSEKDYPTLSDGYNALGNLKFDMQDTLSAKAMYDSSFNIAVRYVLNKQMGIAMGSLSRFIRDVNASSQMRKKAISILQKNAGNEEEIALTLINLGTRSHDPDTAIQYFQSAIRIAGMGNINKVAMAAYNNLAYSFLDKHDVEKAEECLKSYAIPIAEREKNFDWLSTLYDTYSDICIAAKRMDDALKFEQKALKMRAKADKKSGADQVRLLNSLLQARSRELKILQQDQVIGLQNKKVIRLTYLVIGLAGLGLFLVLGFMIIIQRKNLRVQRQELESAKIMAGLEEQDKERLSMQLHDLIRPVRNAVSDHIEILEFSNPSAKLELVNTLEKITASLRQVSHRMNPAMRNKLSFSELVKGIKQDFALSSALNIKMEVVPGDLKLSQDCSNHLYFILHELLANADKHLGKGIVEISVSVELDNLYILYKDDGHGFDPQKANGNGLGISLIRKRIAIMSGHADVESGKGKGTHWIMVLPVAGNVING